MATLIKSELGIEPELVFGGRGEFTVWVDDKKVAKKGWIKFPTEQNILESVEAELG